MPFYIVCQVSGKYHTSLTAHVFISNVYSIHLAFRQVSGSFSSGSRQILIIDYKEQFSGETTSFSTRNVVLKLQLRLRNQWRHSFRCQNDGTKRHIIPQWLGGCMHRCAIIVCCSDGMRTQLMETPSCKVYHSKATFITILLLRYL